MRMRLHCAAHHNERGAVTRLELVALAQVHRGLCRRFLALGFRLPPATAKREAMCNTDLRAAPWRNPGFNTHSLLVDV